MEIEVRTTRGKPITDMCPVELVFIDKLTEILKQVTLTKNSSEPLTKQIKSATEILFSSPNGRIGFKFDGTIPDEYTITNYLIDGVADLDSNSCSHKHRFLVEFCFDNRQAIGTNLLKFELASSIYEEKINQKAMCFLICADKSSIKKLGWDGGVGSSEEYENALRGPYSKLFHSAPVLVVIRN